MAATAQDVRDWIIEGKAKEATHVISICDTFNYDDYPVLVYPNEKLDEEKAKVDNVNMQRINEIIDLSQYDDNGYKITKPQYVQIESFSDTSIRYDLCSQVGQNNKRLTIVTEIDQSGMLSSHYETSSGKSNNPWVKYKGPDLKLAVDIYNELP